MNWHALEMLLFGYRGTQVMPKIVNFAAHSTKVYQIYIAVPNCQRTVEAGKILSPSPYNQSFYTYVFHANLRGSNKRQPSSSVASKPRKLAYSQNAPPPREPACKCIHRKCTAGAAIFRPPRGKRKPPQDARYTIKARLSASRRRVNTSHLFFIKERRRAQNRAASFWQSAHNRTSQKDLAIFAWRKCIHATEGARTREISPFPFCSPLAACIAVVHTARARRAPPGMSELLGGGICPSQGKKTDGNPSFPRRWLRAFSQWRPESGALSPFVVFLSGDARARPPHNLFTARRSGNGLIVVAASIRASGSVHEMVLSLLLPPFFFFVHEHTCT